MKERKREIEKESERERGRESNESALLRNQREKTIHDSF